jgi:hypothetical protein
MKQVYATGQIPIPFTLNVYFSSFRKAGDVVVRDDNKSEGKGIKGVQGSPLAGFGASPINHLFNGFDMIEEDN